MNDFTVRSDSVNVEQIMEQIRARIQEKRGVDYTEDEIRELAEVKLEKLLEPRGLRSDLLEQFRKAQPPYQPPQLPNYAFEDTTLFESHRAPIAWIRRLLRPLLKLFFNPNPLIQALHIQSRLNTLHAEREAARESERREKDQLYFELIHNLVLETTRLGIEVKNLKMRVESLTGRLEFNERRARALESAVVYKPSDDDLEIDSVGEPAADEAQPPEGPGQRSRRRRRRRGRRSGRPAAAMMSTQGAPPGESGEAAHSGTAEPIEQALGGESDAPEPAAAPPVSDDAMKRPPASPDRPPRGGRDDNEPQ
jgi:hypothetical protein